MRKYKLIKKLPFEGSPDVGYISTESSGEEGAHYWNHNWFYPEDYPEFWEEVKDEFPKIISFRRISDKMLYTLGRYDLYWGKETIGGYTLDTMITQGENTSYTEIYQVAVSETEVFTLGDKVKHPFTDGFDVISKFIICKDPKKDVAITIYRPDLIGKLVANVGNCFGNCNIEASKLKKAPEALFVTEDGIEIYEGDLCYLIYLPLTDKSKIEFESRFRKELLPNPSYRLIFATKEAAEKYIDENKPTYSKKQIEDTLINTFIGTSSGIAIFAEIFKRNLGL